MVSSLLQPRTGSAFLRICKFATNCKFHHPSSAPASSTTESLQPNVKLTLAGLPRREGAIHCLYYMKTGACKYGATCRFDHLPPGEVMTMAASATDAAISRGEASSSAVIEAEHNGKNVLTCSGTVKWDMLPNVVL